MSVLRKVYNLRLYLPAIFMIQVWLIFFSMILSIHLYDGKGKWLWFLYFCWCASREARQGSRQAAFRQYEFLLTRLLRGATYNMSYIERHIDFYSRASREARPGNALENGVGFHFYSHASREARPMRGAFCTQASVFLLTRLIRGATRPLLPVVIKQMHFYTRASCEARLQIQ